MIIFLFKPLNIDPSNRIIYSVQNEEMSRLFYVDGDGNFKIIANELTISQSSNKNGTFFIPIRLIDLQGYAENVNVIIQISNFLSQVRCPRISEYADCRYSVNRTVFTPSNKLIY